MSQLVNAITYGFRVSGAVPMSASLLLACLHSPMPLGLRVAIASLSFAIVPTISEKVLAVAMAEDVGEWAADDRAGDVQGDVAGTVAPLATAVPGLPGSQSIPA